MNTTSHPSKNGELVATSSLEPSQPELPPARLTLRKRIQGIIWDTFDYSPEERKFVSKIDFFILYVIPTVFVPRH